MCSALAAIKIPKSVTTIGDAAFAETGIALLEVDDKNLYYCSVDNVLFNKDKTELLFCPKGYSGAYNIPGCVTSVADCAFAGCESMTSVTIPNSVTKIGASSFYGCTGLTSITLPNSVTSIGHGAFEGCSGFTSINIPNSVTSISEGAFFNCPGITSVTIPASVTNLEESVFTECPALTKVDVESGEVMARDFTERGSIAIIFGEQVKEFVIGNDVTTIGKNAFHDYTALEKITIGNSVRTIGEGAFSGCKKLEAVSLPTSVNSIGDYAFDGCKSLGSVDVPGSVTSIGKNAFPLHIRKNAQPEICNKFFGLTLGVSTKQQAISTLLNKGVELVVNTRDALYGRNVSHDGVHFDSVDFLFKNGVLSQIDFSDGDLGSGETKISASKQKKLADYYTSKHGSYKYYFMEPEQCFDDDVTKLLITKNALIFASDDMSVKDTKAQAERYREIHPYSDTRIDKTVLGCTLGSSTRQQVIDALKALNVNVEKDCYPDSIIFSSIKHEGVTFDKVTAWFFAGRLASLLFTKANGLTTNEYNTIYSTLETKYSAYNRDNGYEDEVPDHQVSYFDDVMQVSISQNGREGLFIGGLFYQDCQLNKQSVEFDFRGLRGQKDIDPDKQRFVELFKKIPNIGQ